jgi:hypothetical protein
MHAPSPARFPTPTDDIQTGWYFDRGVEALVFVDRDQESEPGQVNIGAWPRRVWEAMNFSLAALRLMPNAPAIVHGALLQDPSRWR